MPKRSLIFVFFITAVLFIAGIYYIFSLRFSVGDVYPHYSSLRSAPLGSKIFFESLSDIPGNTVMRDHSTSLTWEGGKDKTLFILGFKTGFKYSSLENPGEANNEIFSNLFLSGTRVVISLYPANLTLGPLSINYKPDEAADKKKEKKENKKQDKKEKKEEEKKPDYSFFKKWGFKIKTVDEGEMLTADLNTDQGSADLPAAIKMYSYFYFTDLDDAWDVIYTIKNRPVIISRKYMAGTVILCADSYLFSNEAMVTDRYPSLLSWLVGPADKIYFDESHFGIQNDTGIIDLAYKYRLHGMLLALIIVAGLYIWKNAAHFVPPADDDNGKSNGIKAERDHLDGLVSLLQRHVPVNDLVSTCISEWEKTAVKEKAFVRPDQPSAEELESVADVRGKPFLIYNSICKKLMERKRI